MNNLTLQRRMIRMFEKCRAYIASKISPPKIKENQGITRYITVRFHAPGLPIVQTYDMQDKKDVEAFHMNQLLYPCQIISQSGECPNRDE